MVIYFTMGKMSNQTLSLIRLFNVVVYVGTRLRGIQGALASLKEKQNY
jgi:hypothetical protein